MVASVPKFHASYVKALGLDVVADRNPTIVPALEQCETSHFEVGQDLQAMLPDAPHIVLSGKVRILDPGGRLLTSLESGAVIDLRILHLGGNQLVAGLDLCLATLTAPQIKALQVALPDIRDRLQQAAYRTAQAFALDDINGSPVPPDRVADRGHPRRAEALMPNLRVASPSTRPRRQQKVRFPTPKGQTRRLFQRLVHKYPFVQQQSAVDCGVTCLLMVGRYWGKRFDLNYLRSLANVDRRGASLKGLMIAAETVGFAPRPVKASLDQLAQQPLPAIVHWEGMHYIVVYEVTQRQVLVADPELGPRRLSHADFQAGWTGYTLLLQPTSMLEQAPQAKRSLGRFFALLKPHWLVISEIMVASLVMQVFGIVTPIMTQLLLDRVVVQRSQTTLITVGIGLIIFSLFKIGISSLRRYLMQHTANRIDVALVVGFISHALRLDLNYFETRYVGDITSRIGENQKSAVLLQVKP